MDPPPNPTAANAVPVWPYPNAVGIELKVSVRVAFIKEIDSDDVVAAAYVPSEVMVAVTAHTPVAAVAVIVAPEIVQPVELPIE
jgi:hypothetical protein